MCRWRLEKKNVSGLVIKKMSLWPPDDSYETFIYSCPGDLSERLTACTTLPCMGVDDQVANCSACYACMPPYYGSSSLASKKGARWQSIINRHRMMNTILNMKHACHDGVPWPAKIPRRDVTYHDTTFVPYMNLIRRT